MVTIAKDTPKFVIGRNATREVGSHRWELNDLFANVKAVPINQRGMFTGYDMLYKAVRNKGEEYDLWTPVGSVSGNWRPVETTDTVNLLLDRLWEQGLVKTNAWDVNDPTIRKKWIDKNYKSTQHRVDIPLDLDFTMPRGADVGSIWAPRDDGKETYVPTATIWNGYAGDSALRFGITLFRSACSNGMCVEFLSGSVRKRHTHGSVDSFLNHIRRTDFITQNKQFQRLIEMASRRKVKEPELQLVQNDLSKSDVDLWREYPDNTVNGLINFLSYRQTHNASLLSEARYQKAINRLVKRVAA